MDGVRTGRTSYSHFCYLFAIQIESSFKECFLVQFLRFFEGHCALCA